MRIETETRAVRARCSRGCRDESRRAIILPIALAVLAILAVMAFAVHILRQHNYRGLNWLEEHMRAIAAAEACYTRVLSRLQSGPWEDRWFKDGIKSGTGTWERDSYEFLIGDGKKPWVAELLVWGHAGRAEVAMYWRLRGDPFTLSPYRQVHTEFFTHLEPIRNRPSGGLGPVSLAIDQALSARDANAPWQQAIRDVIHGPGGPQDPLAALGVSADPDLVSRIPPPVPAGASRSIPPGTGAAAALPPPETSGFPLLPRAGTSSGPTSPITTQTAPGPAGGPVTPQTADELTQETETLAEVNDRAGDIHHAMSHGLRNNLDILKKDLSNQCSQSGAGSQACNCAKIAEDAFASTQQLHDEISQCHDNLDRMETALEEASKNAALTEGQARDLIEQSRTAQKCEQGLCERMTALVASVEASLAPCGKTVADQSNPTANHKAICGMTSGQPAQ